MRSGLVLGKLFGIEVRIDGSWFVIFLLISWNWAVVLGNAHGDWATVLRWFIAVLAALLFFAAVLAHELAHSLIARSRGIPVSSIRLHLFGGVSSLQREPDSAGSEFMMAIIGPITSLVIGGGLLLITRLAGGPRGLVSTSISRAITGYGPVITVLAWLGSVNLGLGLFNLIPGFPLDGGRVLRAGIWALTGNLRLATRWASWVGRSLSWVLIVGGIASAFGLPVPLLGQGLVNGLWLAFIGWFLRNAAVQSYQQMVIREALEDVPVSSVMRRDPPTVAPNRTVGELVHNYIMQSDAHGFPVVDAGRLVGIATLQDIRSVARDLWEITSVAEIMTPVEKLATLSPDDNASRALDTLAGLDVHQLPVVSGDRLEGVVRRSDVVRWLQLQSDIGDQTTSTIIAR
jgi:Zn-dependent protease/CBS domain-containing protein